MRPAQILGVGRWRRWRAVHLLEVLLDLRSGWLVSPAAGMLVLLHFDAGIRSDARWLGLQLWMSGCGVLLLQLPFARHLHSNLIGRYQLLARRVRFCLPPLLVARLTALLFKWGSLQALGGRLANIRFCDVTCRLCHEIAALFSRHYLKLVGFDCFVIRLVR